jgi:hypothetical protein
MEKYKVIFNGATAPDISRDQIRDNLIKLFKKQSGVDLLFSGKEVVIKKGVDRETAEKIRQAMANAGAPCRVEPMEHASGTAEVSKGISDDLFENIAIINPVKTSPQIKFTPIYCPEFSGIENGISINHKNRPYVYFSDICLISVFEDANASAHRLNLIFFLYDTLRPLYVSVDRIRFMDFADVSGAGMLESLRTVLKHIINGNPDIILDAATLEFIRGRRPQVIETGTDSHATALGKALDQIRHAEKNMQAPENKKPFEAKPDFSVNRDITEETYHQAEENTHQIPVYDEKISFQQPKSGMSRESHLKRAVIFLFLGIFFALGAVSMVMQLTDQYGQQTNTSYPSYMMQSQAFKRQTELLEYNREMSKVTSVVGLILCGLAAPWFLSRGYRHYKQYRWG